MPPVARHTSRILVLNGPNLNLLGQREPAVYGTGTLTDLEAELRAAFPEVDFVFAQSNHEGALIDRMHEARTDGTLGVVMNPGGFSHTSVALRDAVASIAPVPVVEVHLSNVHAREPFRHRLITAGACVGSIAGLGRAGYHLAVRYLVEREGSQR
ncbi:MAG TPA: type II 3-dehydroquinate dehydratase [Rhodothermales bacterium]|nr:type II 3-dehydroquinate dehydratase [Rhodothermales bacterium]